MAGLVTTSAHAAPAKLSDVELLKNYALSTCVADGYASSEIVNDARAVSGSYLEFGHLPLQAYEDARALGRLFLAQEYQSISNQPLTLMKCLDLFRSKELRSLADKYAKPARH